jgi:uncharacterized protein with GYD domain
MPDYLIQVSYTAEGTAALLRKPQNRIEAVAPTIEKLGGKFVGGGFSFGDYDVNIIVQMPNNTSALALAMAFGSGGTVKTVKTTPLMSNEEAVEAMKKASTAGYKPATQ